MKDTIYYDRWGDTHVPTAQSTFRSRAGAFVILQNEDSILFNYADYAPEVPDFPGGGIDEGEIPLQAALRELHEESELIAPADIKPVCSFLCRT